MVHLTGKGKISNIGLFEGIIEHSLAEIEKNHKKLGQGNPCSDRDSNRAPLE
jgi:hypothetical protein